MDFTLSEQHEQIREVAAQIAREVVAPRARAVDLEGEYPFDYFEAFRDAGLLGLTVPKEYGGSDAGTLGLALAIEEVAKYCCTAGLILLTSRLPIAGIALAGTPEQKERYVRGVAEGRRRGCFALTEPEAGSDSAAITTTAVRDGDSYVLNGVKIWAGQATVADFAVVVAKTNLEAGSRGVSVFIVDLPNPGFHISRELPKLGVLGVPVVEIDLHDCRVPASALLGEENKGFRIVMRNLNVVRPLVAARGVGLAEGAASYALAYAKQRCTFGHPIIEHQAIAFKLAEMAMKVESARLLMYQAAWLVDQGKSDRDIAHFLSIAKATASEMAVSVSEEAIQILGGYGYLKDYAPERYYRDAKQLTIVEGTSEIHRLIISRALNDGLLDWGCDTELFGGFPNDAADKARRQDRLNKARQEVR
jgi:alkylation response protein AidB-like acyl-CoA dehydrogenase